MGQLRGDYIEYFYDIFGERGLERLMNERLVYNNIRFEFFDIDQVSTFTALFIGSNLCFSGIAGDKASDLEKEKEVSISNNPEYLGSYTKGNYSPKSLFSSTISDELKIASQGRSDVYSIAPDTESTIFSAKHVANGASWIDNTSGRWVTTTHCKGIPWYVDRYNNGPESLAPRLEVIVWAPTLPMEKYDAFPYALDDLPFRYMLSEKLVNCYPNLKTSPFINKEINRLALQFLEYGGSDARNCLDMLSATYYAGNYRDTMSKEYTREIQDTYYQLDQGIKKLLDTIDKKAGLAGTLVVSTGSGYYKSGESHPDDLTVNDNEFHPRRCLALFNMYLMAIYSQHTSQVQGYYDDQIYLNRRAVEDAKLGLTTLQNKAVEFIQEFSGMQLITTGRDLLTGDWNEGTAEFRQGTHHQRRGDLVIELQPGREVNLDSPKEKVKIIRSNVVITPLVFMGNGSKPQHIYREVKITEVAPAVIYVLRIGPPNATQSLPLWELTTK